jgi:hypothetical protein
MNRGSSFGILISAFLLASAVAACSGGGGGGGGSSALPSTGGGTNNNAAPGNPAPNNPSATASPPPLGSTPTPVPPGATPGPALQGTMQLATGGSAATGFTYAAETGGSQVVFSCGCTSQAGASLLDGKSTFDIPQSAPATPAAPNPTYTTVPGRNYVIVATASNHAESWALEFLGATPSHNLALSSNGISDVYTAAGTLYVYYYSAINNTDTAFDDWNFNTVSAWIGHMRTNANAAEAQLLNDIAAAQQSGATLYPSAPSWNLGMTPNGTIATDLGNVKNSGDATLPTPCPVVNSTAACTATPTP